MSEIDEETIARALVETGVNIGASTWPDEQFQDARDLARAVLALVHPAIERARVEGPVTGGNVSRAQICEEWHSAVAEHNLRPGSILEKFVAGLLETCADNQASAPPIAPSELADEIVRRRLKFADPADGHYEMLSDEEHDQIAAAIRKG